jgi:hypothetical protein
MQVDEKFGAMSKEIGALGQFGCLNTLDSCKEGLQGMYNALI